MIKFTSNNDFNFSIESVSLVTDTKSLTKRASARDLMRYKKTPNQEDLHIIALGAYEGTGFNRNLDAFMEKDCESNHHLFTDSDRCIHRHHKNKPKDPKYGNIKASAYNRVMKRVELIIGLDRDKCADILDEQERTGNTNWSMASKQAHDVCTWCSHKAKTDNDRCSHIPMKLGELNKEGVMCGMMNPDPRWFEMSYVRRPADRIGMSLAKLASTGELKPMLPRDFMNLYGDIYVPEHLSISKKASDKRALLVKLAELEKHVEGIAQSGPKTSRDLFMSRHADKLTNSNPPDKGGDKGSPFGGGHSDGNKDKQKNETGKGGIPDKAIDQLRKYEPSQILKLLADKGIIFSPEDFAKYLFDTRVGQQDVHGMKSHLPGGFQDAAAGGMGGDVVNNEHFDPASQGHAPVDAKSLIGGMAPQQSMNGDESLKRVMQGLISSGGSPGADMNAGCGPNMIPPAPPEAMKTKSAFHKELAKQYVAYKLAALNYLDEIGKLDEDLMWNAVLQNRF